ncbi:hypothetical protein FA15DRAFT_624859 [Coprinopsis marcescibilis]|uniref:Actin-like ATPase domain-containing protein n=1 Tax=Coprinopsis marcescibilis TaxID=230819 RepID=A0A5C3KKU9_COPMA|nr:hypothetical protein FA15DRAFT_624859 [Coprinopsis marcescibilis]
MSKKPYSGPTRKLLLAFDIGTTFSGVSYCILNPGELPEIRTVTRFPYQGQVGSDSKIPTLVWYNKDDIFECAGAAALRPETDTKADEGGWSKAEWFKMHLRPPSQRPAGFTNEIPSLPPNKNVVQVFGDFLRYLYDCTKEYIKDTHTNGDKILASVEDNTDVVLTQPNGWEGPQQAQMRKAAVIAGIVRNLDEAEKHVSFVTEGEASLHFCIQSGLSNEAMKKGEGTLIVDAGGGNVDLSAYRGKDNKFEEIAIPQCHFQGSIYVTTRARHHFNMQLGNSRFVQDVDNIVREFDKGPKHSFRNDQDSTIIKFGSVRDNEPDLNIKSGQIRVPGDVVAGFFKPSIETIVKAAKEQCESSEDKITSIFLVGGFAASDWLYKKLKEEFDPMGVRLSRPDSHVNKAVSDGAIYFYLDRSVNVRVSKWFYGVDSHVDFNPTDVDHQNRVHLIVTDPVTGNQTLYKRFVTILQQGKKVSEEKEFREHFYKIFTEGAKPYQSTIKILSYRGRSKRPRWIDDEAGKLYLHSLSIYADKYTNAATIEMDLTPLPGERKWSESQRKMLWRVKYDVVILFGLTELRAQVCWAQDGVEKRTPAKIIYEVEGP